MENERMGEWEQLFCVLLLIGRVIFIDTTCNP